MQVGVRVPMVKSGQPADRYHGQVGEGCGSAPNTPAARLYSINRLYYTV